MAFPSRFWADLTTRDFDSLDAASTVAVLPVGACEQHGPHLPLSVDQSLVDGVLAACLPQLPADVPVLVLPTQHIGYSPEHSAFAGTITLPVETVIATWIGIGECVARAGVKKLLLLNGCSWWNLPLGDAVTGLFSAEEHRFGVHGGEIETSMMLALRSKFVDMGQAQDFKSTSQQRAATHAILGNGSSAKLGWAMQDYNLQGAAGNAKAATAEKGRAVLDAAGRQLAMLLREMSSLPLSTLVDK